MNQSKLVSRSPWQRVMGLVFFVLAQSAVAHAAIPQAARDDPRFALGYLVVTHYPGVTSDGGNSTAGLQQAVEDAFDNSLAAFFPPGTYVISDTLKCYEWELWDTADGRASTPSRKAHNLIGSTLGTDRPRLLLAASAPLFDDPGNPRPMLSIRNFNAMNENGTTEVEPDDPMGEPPNFRQRAANLFGAEVRGIDFDVGGHAGAIGVHFPAAQDSSLENVRVQATGGYAGFYSIPSRNGGAANIEVEGGQYGLWINGAGSTIVGARLYNQTASAIVTDASVPLAIVGCHIRAATGSVIEGRGTWSTANGTYSFVDGIIELANDTLAIDNSEGRSIYLRNVYFSGTTQLVRGGSEPTITGSGSWSCIEEYSYSDQSDPAGAPNYSAGDSRFRSFSLIDGVLSRTPQPSVAVESDVPAPPDLVARHVVGGFSTFEGQDDGTIVITSPPYGATPDDDTDDLAAIQAAVDDASATGHGRVYVPEGTFHISDTLVLRHNTHLTGATRRVSRIASHDGWRPTVGQATLVATDDAPDATTLLGFLSLWVRSTGDSLPDGSSPYDRFNHLHWRAGARSATLAVEMEKKWASGDLPSNAHHIWRFTGNGGGRHYFVMTRHSGTADAHPDVRGVYISGTTQPLWFYGLNAELTKGGTPAHANIEIVDAANIRVLGIKREARSPTALISNATNVGFFSIGAMNSPPNPDGSLSVLGSSSDIVVANVNIRAASYLPNGSATLLELLDGGNPVDILWPENVSLYRRGALHDELMLITPDTPVCNNDGVCDSGESCQTCADDCGPCAGCPNGVCEAGETCGSCPQDCCAPSNSALACRTSEAVAVDGSGDDWTSNDVAQIGASSSVILTNAPEAATSDADCSATFSASWDPTHLYVLVSVVDG